MADDYRRQIEATYERARAAQREEEEIDRQGNEVQNLIEEMEGNMDRIFQSFYETNKIRVT